MIFSNAAVLPRGVLAQEAPAALDRAIVKRCENWAHYVRLRRLRGQANSLEGGYRPPRGANWETRGAPTVPPTPELHDAQAIEDAVSILALYHHTLLRAWYVNKWHPGKCLAVAAEAAGVPRGRFSGFDAALEMAHGLLRESLRVPPVIRKMRARQIVRELVGS
jgi:hypothetical protein